MLWWVKCLILIKANKIKLIPNDVSAGQTQDSRSLPSLQIPASHRPPPSVVPHSKAFHNPGLRRVGSCEIWPPLSYASPATSDFPIMPPTQFKCPIHVRPWGRVGKRWPWDRLEEDSQPDRASRRPRWQGLGMSRLWAMPTGVTKCAKQGDAGTENRGRGCPGAAALCVRFPSHPCSERTLHLADKTTGLCGGFLKERFLYFGTLVFTY